MTVLLISKTPIVIQIFKLICSKFKIKLTIRSNNNIKESFDIIVVDQDFIDSSFNDIRNKSKKIGAISSEELSFDKNRDFLIKRPFLPSDLSEILSNQINNIMNNSKKEVNNSDDEIVSKQNSTNTTKSQKDYMDMLAGNIIDSIDEKPFENSINNFDTKVSDEESQESSIVTIPDSTLKNNSNIFNMEEINKIQELLGKDKSLEDITKLNLDSNILNSQWDNLSEIIDEAIIEAGTGIHQPKDIIITLNNYTMKELTPLFRKLDQNIIDDLRNGKVISVKLRLNKTK